MSLFVVYFVIQSATWFWRFQRYGRVHFMDYILYRNMISIPLSKYHILLNFYAENRSTGLETCYWAQHEENSCTVVPVIQFTMFLIYETSNRPAAQIQSLWPVYRSQIACCGECNIALKMFYAPAQPQASFTHIVHRYKIRYNILYRDLISLTSSSPNDAVRNNEIR